MFNVAMIGVGDITMLHYPAYRDFEHARLKVLCDVDAELLARRSECWDVAETTSDYQTILDDGSIDIVEVNTPHHLHEQIVVEALKAGKHVACQKPIATRISEAERMVEAANKSTGQFRILENFVFYPPYVKAKELLDSGEIGDPLTVRFKLGTSLFGSRWVPLKTELWHLTESEYGRGQAVFDDGYHKLSMAMYLFGEIASIKGFIDRSFRYIDEPAQLIWRYKDSQVLGSFDIAFSPSLYIKSDYFSADERIDIVGAKGTISLTCCTGRLMDEAPLILSRGGKRYLFDDLETDWQASFIDAIRDFPLAIEQSRQSLLSGQRALAILRFAYALTIGAKLGIELRPDEITDDLVVREFNLKKSGSV